MITTIIVYIYRNDLDNGHDAVVKLMLDTLPPQLFVLSL